MLKNLLRLTFYFLPLIAFAANFTESPAEVAKPLSKENGSLPVKVIIHKVHPVQFSTPFGRLSVPLKAQGNKSNALAVRAYVQSEALEHGVNPKLALWIVKHESQFNPYAKGDGEASRGLWQISKIYHPEVSDAAAFNVASSTEWSLERIRSGKANEWSTYRFCRTLYVDCPF